MRDHPQPRRFRAGLPCAIALGAMALLIAACGSSTTHSLTVASDGHGASGESLHTTPRVRGDVSDGVAVHRPMRGTGGSEINDDNPGRADSGTGGADSQGNPCTLVSQSEAQAIIGHQIATPQEAPLGPTCIYRPLDTKSFVSLTVEALDFAKLKPQIRKRTQVHVGGRTAYCGEYGQQTTFLPMPDGRVLSISAPCAVGVRFAGRALPRLSAFKS